MPEPVTIVIVICGIIVCVVIYYVAPKIAAVFSDPTPPPTPPPVPVPLPSAVPVAPRRAPPLPPFAPWAASAVSSIQALLAQPNPSCDAMKDLWYSVYSELGAYSDDTTNANPAAYTSVTDQLSALRAAMIKKDCPIIPTHR